MKLTHFPHLSGPNPDLGRSSSLFDVTQLSLGSGVPFMKPVAMLLY